MSMRTLRPGQVTALQYAQGQSSIALFMEMRLGKSAVAIRWAWATKIPAKHLIVAPLTTLPGWEEELEKEGFQNVYYLTGNRSARMAKSALAKPGWFLINYQGLRVCPQILRHGFSTIICDESTFIRNPKAQITKLLVDECPIRRRAILTGLPNPESPLDYFQQMKFLDGQFMGFTNYWDFRERLFWAPPHAPYDWMPRMGIVSKIKEAVHKRAFVLTRKDAGVGPEKVYEKRFVELNPKQKKLYKEVNKTFEYKSENLEMATKWATTKFIWLARIAGGFGADGKDFLSDEKVKELLYLLQGELKHEKVVVWFRFNSEIQYVSECLERARISHRVIFGEVTQGEPRAAATRDFRTPKVQVMLAQVKCGKFGLDWSCSSTAIYYSNSYDMEDRSQSEDRILNVDRKEPLLYIDLVTKNTIDESISKVLRNKYDNSRLFMTALVKDWLQNRRNLK